MWWLTNTSVATIVLWKIGQPDGGKRRRSRKERGWHEEKWSRDGKERQTRRLEEEKNEEDEVVTGLVAEPCG